MSPQEDFLKQVDRRARSAFGSLADGHDLPPGERLRLEGFIQAGLVMGWVGLDQVLEILSLAYRDCFGTDMPEPFPPYDPATCILPLPGFMARAPVVPTTSD